MDVSKISQSYIDGRVEQYRNNMDEQTVEECNVGLFYADQNGNGDGQVSGIEMYKSWSETCAFVFEGHEAYAARGEEIAIAQGELYSRYAGEDGVLDAYEYNAALQSDEMGVLIAEYWEMKNEVEALNGETDIKGLSRYDSDGNRDGQTSAVEIYKSKAELNEQKYGDNPDIQAKADEISMRQAEILNKFAGEDGVLTSKEYAAGVQSDEYQETMREYSALLDFYNWAFNK